MANIQFIPYTFEKSKSTYFDYRPVMSYGTKTVVVIGARRIGKTYGAKKYCTKKRIYKKELTAWLRDHDEARKRLAMNDGQRFFSDYIKEFKDKEGNPATGSIRGETIYFNGDTLGYLMPCSTFQNYKGNDFQDIKTIVYDEFIPEKGKFKDENKTWEFINSMYTILSTRRDAKAILLANALDRGDAILDLFGFKINDFGIYINREKDVALHYCDNSPEFNKARETSIVGKWIKDTIYEDNLFHNQFADDTQLFYDKRPSKCILMFRLSDGENSARVYYKDQMLYVSEDFDREGKTICYVHDIRAVDTRHQLIPPSLRKNLSNCYNSGYVRFKSPLQKNLYIKFIKTT